MSATTWLQHAAAWLQHTCMQASGPRRNTAGSYNVQRAAQLCACACGGALLTSALLLLWLLLLLLLPAACRMQAVPDRPRDLQRHSVVPQKLVLVA